MRTTKPGVAALQGFLILPAAIFMVALVVRNIPQDELARNAQRIVMWYAARQWTLWILLIALPLTVLVTGWATLRSEIRPRVASRFVAASTLMAGGALVVVFVHMLAN